MGEVELSLRIPKVTFGQWLVMPPSKNFLMILTLEFQQGQVLMVYMEAQVKSSKTLKGIFEL